MDKPDNSSIMKILGIIAALAGIVGVCAVIIVLIPAFGQWLTPIIGIPTKDSLGPSIPADPQSNVGNVIMSDDFSTTRWGTRTDADSSIEYANDALQMIVYKKNYFVWSPPNGKDYQNIHMEVTVLNNGTDSTTAFGIICNKQGSTSNFNYLVMTPAGEYAIARAAEGHSDVFLTNNDQWAASSQIAQDASSYRVGVDCGNGTLTLYVDGLQIASASDSTYTGGGVALMVWSGEEATTTDIYFDDFLMMELP